MRGSEFWLPKGTMPPIESRARLSAQITFAVLLVLLALWVASDFLTALLWATVIAITSWPIYTRFAALINKDHSSVLAPSLFTLLTRLVLIVPIALTVHQIVQGSDAFVHWVTQLRQDEIPVPSWIAQLPVAGEYLERWWQANLSNPRTMVGWLRGVNLESVTAWSSESSCSTSSMAASPPASAPGRPPRSRKSGVCSMSL
jgi:predicted PurR-regulated permease PerM